MSKNGSDDKILLKIYFSFRILKFGLDGFAANSTNPQNSEIGILAELSVANESSLLQALKKIILEHFDVRQSPHTIPYLIHLCRISPVLLQPIVKVFLQLFEEDKISLKHFQQNLKDAPNPELYTLLTSLAMRINENGTRILLHFAKLGEVTVCFEILEHILLELEYLILDDRNLSGEYPLLLDVLKEQSKPMLWKNCLSSNPLEQQTAIRLILLIAPRSPYSYHQTVVELMQVPDLAQGVVVRVLGGVSGICLDFLDPKTGIEMCLDLVVLNQKRSTENDLDKTVSPAEIVILRNLLKLIRLEKANSSIHLRKSPVSTTLSRYCIPTLTKAAEQCFKNMGNDLQLIPFTSVNSETVRCKKMKSEGENSREKQSIINEQLHLIMEILDRLDIKVNLLNTVDILRVTQLVVRYFFRNLSETDSHVRIQCTDRILSLLKRFCSGKKAARTCALRELIEEAVYSHRNLFGAFNEDSDLSNNDSLLTLNQNQDVISGTNRSVLHAGLIGHGLKSAEKPAETPSKEIQKMFMDAISACCAPEISSDSAKDRTILTEGFSTLSLLLVELVSPDVMYNGLPWPEEEFSKVTMERDLQIRRMFRNAPILWSILSLTASHRPALCISSVLLRALCASVLHQWRARSVEKSFGGTIKHPDLMFVTQKLLEIMAQGQVLPTPLNYINLVIEYLDPSEVALILRDCVWNYMREHVPSPVLFECNANGVVWRNPDTNRPTSPFTDPLRRIMLKRLPVVGALYHQMFVLPDQIKPV